MQWNGTKKKWLYLPLMLSFVVISAACGNGNNAAGNDTSGSTASASPSPGADPSPSPLTAPAASEAPAATDTAAAGNSSDEPLVVYLNDFDNIIKPLFEQATGYKLELVVGNGAEISSRIEAEKGNPHWDVVWMDSMPTIDQMDKNGQLLTDYTPAHLDGLTDFAKQFVPADKGYFPTGAHAASVIVYNKNEVDEASAPKTWADLSDPKFKGAVGMADPAVAAPAYPFVSWFFQDQGMDGGKKYFQGLMDNGAKVYPKNPNVVTALTGGELKVAALQESNAYAMVNEGDPINIVWPAEGSPASVRVAAIQKNTKHTEAAKAFIDFLLDPKTQQALIDQGDESYFEPSEQDVNPKADRAPLPAAKLVVAEAGWAGEHEGEIKQWFADNSVK